MTDNKIITISEDEFFSFQKDAHKVMEQLNLKIESSRIYYKYTISGNNMLIEIESDFRNLVNNRSQKKRKEDDSFIKYLGYDFCFINKDILKLTLEDSDLTEYWQEDLSDFIQGKVYNTGYEYIMNTSDDIEQCVLILTLQR